MKEKNRQIRPNPTGLRRERFAYAESIVSFAENRSKEMGELALQKEETVEKVQTNAKEMNKDVKESVIQV